MLKIIEKNGRRHCKDLQKKLADKVKRTKKKVVLEPMNRYERKIIHTSLQDLEDITTYSEGVEPNRKVIIKLKN